MAAATTYTKTGTQAKATTKLDSAVFGVAPNDYTLLKQAYLSHLANTRQNLAVTKTRAEVRGGGRKPWRQKGTGRARAGSIRSPIWRGGGITFGPRGVENYRQQIPKQAKRLALRQALSLKAQAKAIRVVEAVALKDGKVKEVLGWLGEIGVTRRVLLVVGEQTELLDRATRNLAEVEVRTPSHLNVFAVLNADNLLITKPALKQITERLKETK